MDPAVIELIARRLGQCQSVLFVTGAGISADSGLPTYRGIGGLYHDSETADGIPIEVALSGTMLMKNPAVAWKHIGQIESSCRGASPNAGHEVIKRMESTFDRVWTFTQNVDGFHRLAGSKNVIEIHGDVHRLLCTGCGRKSTVRDYADLEFPPKCDECSSVIRPEVVLFGEMLPSNEIQILSRELHKGFDAVFSIGTTSVFPYIAQPVMDARSKGALTVEINPGNSEVSNAVDYKLSVGAAEALSAIEQALRRVMGN